jgi:nucleoside permease NupC
VSDNHPDPNQWWFHRRVMAYISLVCLLGILIALLTNNVATDVLPLAQTLAWVFSANLLYYYGGNAVEAVRK